MYSTASERPGDLAAYSYRAFSDEIGHFQFCGAKVPATLFGIDSSGNLIACPAATRKERR
jgi:hypothetical protein